MTSKKKVTSGSKPDVTESKKVEKVEAWKSVIDFNKTSISLASGILLAVIGFFVFQGQASLIERWNWVSPALLVLSIACSIYGFGRAISAIGTSKSDWFAVLLTNLGPIFVVAGIFCLLLIERSEAPTIDSVLSAISDETKSYPVPLTASSAPRVEYQNGLYVITYTAAGKSTVVKFDETTRRIVSIGN